MRILVNGRVQGVGFRYYTLHVAQRLGVKGYVRNLPDGRVEAYAEAENAVLQQFVRIVENGPSNAVVEDTHKEWLETTGNLDSFRITY